MVLYDRGRSIFENVEVSISLFVEIHFDRDFTGLHRTVRMRRTVYHFTVAKIGNLVSTQILLNSNIFWICAVDDSRSSYSCSKNCDCVTC